MGARNRAGVALSDRPAGLHRLAESIPWNRFLSTLIVKNIVYLHSYLADALDVHTRENQRKVSVMSYLHSHCEGHRFMETLYRSLNRFATTASLPSSNSRQLFNHSAFLFFLVTYSLRIDYWLLTPTPTHCNSDMQSFIICWDRPDFFLYIWYYLSRTFPIRIGFRCCIISETPAMR